jgi:hypothetical protein
MRTYRWVALVGAVAVTTSACDLTGNNDPVTPAADSAVAVAAAGQAARALEADATFAGEVTQEAGWHPLCVSRPMGISPDAATVAEVDTVYAWVYCKWVRPGGTGSDLPGLASPVVVHLKPTVSYQLPQDGEGYATSIKELFPKSLRDAAIDGSPDEAAAMAELDARVAREQS